MYIPTKLKKTGKETAVRMHFTTDRKTDIIRRVLMDITVDMLIREILRIMADESALSGEDGERLYRRIFGGKREGETDENK